MEFDNSWNLNLVGLDKSNTINAYYARDLAMGLSNSNTVVSHLKKLGYWDLNATVKEQSYIKNKISHWIKTHEYTDIVNVGVPNLVTEIRASQDYTLFTNRLNQRLERANQLVAYINNSNTYEFYSALTLEELNTLGY
jgi:hypothetical protein